jgi:hypothetical protein
MPGFGQEWTVLIEKVSWEYPSPYESIIGNIQMSMIIG